MADISGMPAYKPPAAVDISGMPAYSAAPNEDEEIPEVTEGRALAAGTEAGLHTLVAGTAGAAGRLAGRVADVLPGGADWDPTKPRKADTWSERAAAAIPAPGPEAQGAEQAMGEAGAFAGRQAAKIPGVDTPAGQTALEYGNEFLQDIGLGSLATAPYRAGFRAASEGAPLPRPAVTPPKTEPGPITAASLRAQPDPLAPAAPSVPAPGAIAKPVAVPVPGKPHITPKAPAPVAATAAEAAEKIRAEEAAAPSAPEAPQATRFTPPEQEGTQHGALPPEAQAARQDAIQRLNADAGNPMTQVRSSALTGDYGETGNDHQSAKLGSQTMRAQIASENEALKSASSNATARAGGAADGVDSAALAERGTTIDNALTGVRDWFDNHIRTIYSKADASAAGRPIQQFPEVQKILSSPALFGGTPEGEALHRGAVAWAQHLGIVGNDGVFKPATVETAERFRQWAGEQYTPRTGRLVGRLKDAMDADVASHGGPGLYSAGRALRAKRDQMLEGPTGISRLLANDKTGINRPVPIEQIPDNVANMPRDQFNHVVNVLKSSAHLGDGELAESSAAALNEIRGHMAARLHEAGASARDGTWDPFKYHKQLDKYALKLPGVFSPEGIQKFKTINEAGNALRMDRSYPGAAAQIQQAGGLRALAAPRIAGAIEGLVTDALPFGNTIGEITGLAPAGRKGLERVIGGSKEAAVEKAAAARLQPIGPGAKQRGGPKFENNASGESSASLEAQSRVAQEKAKGQSRYLINPDASEITPLRGVDAVDAKAPPGHIIVQRGVGAQPYSILDRGGLPATQANGLLARAHGLGTLREAEKANADKLLKGKKR